jgi:phage protein D
VAPDLSLIKIEHIDQSNETDMGFLTRLAYLHDAVAKPINELYVLARRGQAKSLSGKVLPTIKLSVTANNRPGDHAFISAILDETARAKYQGCKTRWWDAAAGSVRVEESGIAPFKTLRQRFQSADDARAAGEGEVRRMMREALKVTIACPGNPGLSAEGVVLLDPTWPDFMRGRWSIDKVTATGDREKSYRCTIDATCLDAKA